MSSPKSPPAPRIVDLTHPLFDGAPAFPSDPVACVRPQAVIAREKFNTSFVSFGSHQGTHLDAMYHFFDDGRTLDRMPLDWFFGPAHVLHIPREANGVIGVEALAPHEDLLTPEAKIIVATGWHRRFGSSEFFTSFPSFTPEAARYLAGRRIRLLGMDMPSLGQQWLELHHILLAPDVEVVVVEGLANLDALPGNFTFAGFPLNITGRDGSPIRAVAICN